MQRTYFQQGNLRLRHRVRGPGIWEFRYRAVDESGTRRSKSVVLGTTEQYPTKADLGPKLRGLILSINTGAPLLQDATMGALISRFIADEHLEELRAGKTVPGTTMHYSTARSYLGMLARYIRPRWGDLQLSAIRPAAIQEWLNGLLLAPKTKAHLRGLLHQLFDRAMLWELINLQRNPVELVKIKGATKRLKLPTVLTIDQFHAIAARLPQLQRTMMTLAQWTGLRASEVLALQWRDLDFEQRTMQVTRAVVNGRVGPVKTECANDLLPLDQRLADLLREWQGCAPPSPEGWVFANPVTLRPYNASSIQRYLEKIGAELSIRLGWHTFRHTYRSWLDATGAPIGVQQKLMRHAQVSTTMNIYGNALMQSKREANSKIVGMSLEGQQSSQTDPLLRRVGEVPRAIEKKRASASLSLLS
jgi:integrase